jgi:hypothetical protein
VLLPSARGGARGRVRGSRAGRPRARREGSRAKGHAYIYVLPISTTRPAWWPSRRRLSGRSGGRVASAPRTCRGTPGWRAAAAGGGEGRDRTPWGALGLVEGLRGPEARLGDCAGSGGRLGSRELIFKISHTKPGKNVQNLDPRSDLARAHLHLARWVYEGGESRESRQGGGQCSGEVWRLLRESPPLPPGQRPGAASGTPPPPTPGPERRTHKPVQCL